MREDFEHWAEGKIALVHYDGDYANLDAQIAWSAWQRAWTIAVREQRRRDEVELDRLRHKIQSAIAVLEAKK